jgi:dephospho-CoA kinase
MLKLGVTGGIGSGKSVICKILECFGIPIFRADDEGRRLLLENAGIQKQVVQLFGNNILKNGKPDPKKIASIVFNNPDKLKKLNNIIHPAISNAFFKWSSEFQSANCVVEEAAILFESGAEKNLDTVLLVTAPEELKIRRVMQRDNITETEIKKRMKFQWSDEKKIPKADFVLFNEENTLLTPQVIGILRKLHPETPEINW